MVLTRLFLLFISCFNVKQLFEYNDEVYQIFFKNGCSSASLADGLRLGSILSVASRKLINFSSSLLTLAFNVVFLGIKIWNIPSYSKKMKFYLLKYSSTALPLSSIHYGQGPTMLWIRASMP